MKSTSKTGERGVLLLIEELLKRDLNPFRPVVDDHGVDLMLSGGKRIQVKSANLSTHKRIWTQKVYQFSCTVNVFGRGGRALGLTVKRRAFADSCDYVVLVGLDEKRFWIIPASIVDEQKCTTLVMGPLSKPMPSALDVKRLSDQGKSRDEIADELGCRPCTVSSRKAKGDVEKGKILGHVRSFENRWDLLEQKPERVPQVSLPTIYERDPDFIASLAGPIAA